jgi:hypothetical protein
LLQAAGHRPGGRVATALQDRYDAFFLVERAAVCRRTFTAQLVRRLSQVACDLAADRATGRLHGPAPGRDDGPPDEALADLVAHPTDVLCRLAHHVADDDRHRADGQEAPSWTR